MRTLEDACKDFYKKGFVSFEFLSEDSGVVIYKDGSGDYYKELNVIENGKRVPKKLEIITRDEVSLLD